MLPFFPTPYEDELLYSVFARYHRWSRNPSPKHTMQDLFGSVTASAIVDFPDRLDELFARLPEGSPLTIRRLIMNHTLFPLFSPFLPNSRVQNILSDMRKDDRGSAVTMAVGTPASTVPKTRFLRFCPDCMETDLGIGGEPYWHRIHQVPGVFVCPWHGKPLYLSSYSISSRSSKHEFHLLSSSCDRTQSFDFSPSTTERLQLLAKDVVWLLNHEVAPNGLDVLLNRYRRLLQKQGLMTARNSVRQSDLITAFNRYFGDEMLTLLGSLVDPDQYDNWLMKAVRSSRNSIHPIRHLLLMRFLGETPESFLISGDSVSLHPFGLGPWPCLNAASSHYRSFVIETCIVTRDFKLGVPVGTFVCACGFVYSRRGPDTTAEDKYRIGRIKEFGRIWDECAYRLFVLEGQSLRETARRLYVDPKTIKSRINSFPNKSARWMNGPSPELRNAYRKRWTKAKDSHPQLSKTELRRQIPATFTWLYRHDRSWLCENSPSKKLRRQGVARVNWNHRDKELVNLVYEAAERLRKQADPPVRVSVSAIGKLTGHLSILQKYIDKIPETARALDVVTESREQFQIRRVQNASSEMRQNGQAVREWSLIRRAGLRPGFGEAVKKQIQIELGKEADVKWR